MALFIKRVESVVSLRQLEAAVAADACGASVGAHHTELAPDAPVSGIAWSRLPKYSFAADAAPARVSRHASLADLARVVPDMDDAASEGSSAALPTAAGGAGAAAHNSDATMAAAAASAAAFGGGVTAAKAAAAADGGFGLLSSGSLLLREANVDGSGANSGASSGATGGGGLLGAGGAGGNASAGCLLADMCDGSSSCDGSVLEGGSGALPTRSLLDGVLLALWEECAEAGLFRYDVTACPTKVVPGLYGFVAQLNEGRYSKKRPTEFRVDQVVQPFDPAKFNFTKAFRREVLFAFEPATGAAAAASPAATKALAQSSTAFEEAGRAGRSPTLVLINVSPIDYGHVLLCPRVLDCLPQNLDAATVRTALHFALEVGNPYLRVGFNSLGAFATINHLHFQAYYLAAPLPCERAPTRALPLRRGAQHAQHSGASAATTARAAEHDSHPVAISLLADYPVRGWVVEGPSLAGMAQVVGDASLALQAANIPHNVLIADCGARVFIWPQAYAERQARGLVPEELLDVGVNPAVWEISGHLVLKRARDYAEFTEGAAWALLAAVSLTEADIARLSEQLWGGSGEAVGTGLAMGSVPADSGGAGAAAAGGGSGGGDPMVGVVPAAGATRPPQPQHLLAAAAACCN